MFRSYDPDDGLNQLTAYAGKALTHDAKGNVTGFGSDSFAYSSENRMSSATVGGAGTTFSNDPMHRLFQVIAGGAIGRFSFDGLNAVSEHDGNNANALLRRWVHDPTTGQPVAQYEGTGVAAANRRYFSADERGSIVSVSDSTGASLGLNSYDEYGNPGGTVTGRYGFAGQPWIGSAGLWYMNARMYSGAIGGRFMQSDPIGFAGGINLYAYVGNDPVNAVDPLGLDEAIEIRCDAANHCITVTGVRPTEPEQQPLPASLTGGGSPNAPRSAGPAKPKPKPKPKAKQKPKPKYCSSLTYKAGVLVGYGADAFSDIGLFFYFASAGTFAGSGGTATPGSVALAGVGTAAFEQAGALGLASSALKFAAGDTRSAGTLAIEGLSRAVPGGQVAKNLAGYVGEKFIPDPCQ